MEGGRGGMEREGEGERVIASTSWRTHKHVWNVSVVSYR